MAEPVTRHRDIAAPLAATTQPLLVVDEHGVVVETSLGASRILGLSRSEPVGVPFANLLSEESRERFGLFWQAFRGAGGHGGPFRLAPDASADAIEISVEAETLPGRHLISLTPVDPAGGQASAVSEPSAAADAPPPRQPTRREREILTLLAGGATDGEIADQLGLSPATVQTHVRNAKAKIGARTRAQAVAMALRGGLIAVV